MKVDVGCGPLILYFKYSCQRSHIIHDLLNAANHAFFFRITTFQKKAFLPTYSRPIRPISGKLHNIKFYIMMTSKKLP